jgi:hypothetical protein
VFEGDLLNNPVVGPGGHTFSGASIRQHIALRGNDPMTGLPLSEADLRPNLLVRDILELFHFHHI